MICRIVDSKSTVLQYLQFHIYVLLSMSAFMNNLNYLLEKNSKQTEHVTEFRYLIVLVIGGLLNFKPGH